MYHVFILQVWATLVSMLVTRHECIYALLTNTISNAFKASCRVMAARNDKRRPSRPDPPPYKQPCMPRHIVVCNKQLQQLGQVHPITKQPAKPCIVINNCHVARLYTHRYLSTYHNVTCACTIQCHQQPSTEARLPPKCYYYYYWTASGDYVQNVIITEAHPLPTPTPTYRGVIPIPRIESSCLLPFLAKQVPTTLHFPPSLPLLYNFAIGETI